MTCPPRGVAGRAPFGWWAALALTLLRLALAPVLVVLVRTGAPGVVFASVLVAGFVSDVLDGVVARRAGVASPFLRRLDSGVDTVFYLAVAFVVWRLHPEPLRALLIPIAIVIAGEVVNALAALAKFRREASYHAWSARVWGLLLFLALLLLLGFGTPALLPLALVAGIVAQVESMAITMVLPTWRHDIPTVWHAVRLARTG